MVLVDVLLLVKRYCGAYEILMISSTCSTFRKYMDIYQYYTYNLEHLYYQILVENEELKLIVWLYNRSIDTPNIVMPSKIAKIKTKSTISNEYIRENMNMIDWVYLPYNVKLSQEIINEVYFKIDPSILIRNQTLSNEFIITHFGYLSEYLNLLIIYQKLSEDIILRILTYRFSSHNDSYFKETLLLIIKYQSITEDFLGRYVYYVYPNMVIKYVKLSEQTLENIIHKSDNINYKIDLLTILKYQDVSESFIVKHVCQRKNNISYDKLEFMGIIYDKSEVWYYICLYQRLTTGFIIEYKDMINYIALYKNKKKILTNIEVFCVDYDESWNAIRTF